MTIKQIIPLFAKHLISGKLDVDHKNIELDLNEKFSTLEYYSEGDKFYKSSPYLHREDAYKELSNSIIHFVNTITNDVFCYESLQPEITLMWATGTTKGSNIHRHYHPNSFFSGVYYPQKIDYAPIRFYTPYRPALLPTKYANNMYNAYCIPYHPTQGDIIIFPSDLEHDTHENLEDDIRLSVAFNIFFKGEYGNEGQLSKLSL
jgi:uncharacterized protein (TIGR02466 family)